MGARMKQPAAISLGVDRDGVEITDRMQPAAMISSSIVPD